MVALIDLPQPLELARVEAAPQDFMDSADGHRAPALAIGEALLASHRANFLQGIAARRIPLEQAGNNHPLIGLDRNPLLAVRADDVPISERRGTRPQALLGLLQHALADLFGEIVDIVLRHQDLDAVHELFGGPGFPRKRDALFHQMDFGIQFVDRHPITQVAIEAVGLFHEDGLHRAVLAEETDHLAEIGAAAVLGGLDVHIFGCNGEPVGFGVIAQKLELGGNRKALALLLAGRDARVDHRLGDGLHFRPLLLRPSPCCLRHADAPDLRLVPFSAAACRFLQ
ncbi:hypothetical protein V2S85_02520 [Novosphingobium resinovorum]|nr:hypothetical protein [Novosphingobium resinovorum]